MNLPYGTIEVNLDAPDTSDFTLRQYENLDNHQQINYKYAEDQIISDFAKYIDRTYTEHYKAEDEVECFDAWIALGTASGTFRDTAMKYLWRYGKKGGSNKDDLMKALHYVTLLIYNEHYKKD